MPAESVVTDPPLTADQLSFLAFSRDMPKPFAWRWLRADGETISYRPETHAYLAARKRTKGGEVRSLVTVAELEGLRPYWSNHLLALNATGVAIIEAERQA